MFRSFPFKTLAVLASLIFLAGAANAQLRGAAGLDTTKQRHFIDRDCTDANSVPATTVNVSLKTLANWDTMAEAVNPDRNIGNAAQTSGSADGWCDTEPWKISGTIVSAASSSQYIGPLITNASGFYISWYAPTIITSYQHFFGFSPEYNTTTYVGLGGTAALTATTASLAFVTPIEPTSSQATAIDNFYFPVGRPSYYRLTTTGVGTFNIDVEFLSAKQLTPDH